MKTGVFWLIDNVLFSFPFDKNKYIDGIAKSPHIAQNMIKQIASAFELEDLPIIKYDFSEHYKCYFD